MLTGFGQLAQAPLIGFGLYADAATVGQYAPPLARELAELAGKYEQVAALIDPLIKVGPFTAIIAVALPFIAQLGVNHKRLPAGVMGTVPPGSLAAQMELAIAREQAVIMAAQAAAEQELSTAREQIAEQRRQMQPVPVD